MDAAERCFERYEIGRTTMADVAAEANVSRPTVYRYFGDRESLIAAISERRAGKVAEQMRSQLSKYESFEDQLIEGMLQLARLGGRDQFFRLLVTPQPNGASSRAALSPPGAVEFATAVWQPIFDAAEQQGSLRAGIDRQHAYQWLISVTVLLIGSVENVGRVTRRHRELVRELFVPAFVNRRG